MLKDRNIAFFIDVDNVGLNSEQYKAITDKLAGYGSILCGKIYGAGERKHKEIYADADLKGYTTLRPMRIKRRGRKDFDARIYVDVVDAVNRAVALDMVCIVAQPTDLIHLYSYLHARGIKIVALANGDSASNALIDEVLDIGAPAPAKPAQKPANAPAKKPAKEPEQPAKADTDELIREIEHLKSIADETDDEPAPATKPAKKTPATKQPAVKEQPAPAKQASSAPSSERDLIKRIEEIRNSSKGDDDDFVDEIKKLLDGLE